MPKRKHERLDTWEEIEIMTPDGKVIGRGGVNNLSEGGVFAMNFSLEDGAEAKENQDVTFRTVLPTGEVSGKAIIAWIGKDKDRLGLKFTSIDNDNGANNIINFLYCGFCDVKKPEPDE